MADKDLGIVELNRKEHDDALGIPGKRVFPWGFDGANMQPISVDSQGQLKISGTITGGVTTVFQGGNWNLASTATIYAVVNTAAAGQASVVLDAGTKQIGSVTIAHPLDIRSLNSTATLFAVVNTGAVGNTNALATLLAGPNQIGSVTVSNVINSIVTIAPRTDYLGLVSVNGGVVNLAGTAQIGSVTISNQQPLVAGTAQIGSVTISNQPPLIASSAYIGLVSVNVGGTLPALAVGTATIGIVRLTPLIAGTAQIGSVTIANQPPLIAGTAQIGSVTVSSIGVGTAQIGSVTVSNVVNSLATIVNMNSGKTWLHAPIAITSTNLSGATLFVAAASKKFYITNLILSNASAVGINFLSGATYLTGNPSVRMQLAANSGIVEKGSVDGPAYFGLAAQQNFLLATDTAAPISGKVIWYEE